MSPTSTKKTELLFATVLFFSMLVFKLFFTPEITIQGDEFEKWYEAKRVLYGFEFSHKFGTDHHITRFGIMWPTYIFQFILGPKPAIYHVLMAAVFAGIGLSGYFISKELTSYKPQQILSVTLICLSPLYLKVGSQLLPSPFSVLYMFLTILFLIKLERYPESRRFMLLAVLCFFLAYGSKITNVYFLPAILAYVYFYIEKKQIQVFLLALAICYLGEQWLNFYIFGEFSLFSRIDHMYFHVTAMEVRVYEPYDIFRRWLQLPKVYFCVIVLSLVLSIVILVKHRNHAAMVLMASMLLTYALFFTFAITSIAPLKFAEPLRIRYFLILLMLSYLLIPYCLSQLFPRQRGISVVVTALIILINLPATLARWDNNAFTVNQYADTVTSLYGKGVWLLFTTFRVAKLHRAMYLDDRYLFENGPNARILGKTHANYFREDPKGRVIFLNMVRKPVINEYLVLRSQEDIAKDPSKFIPPKDRVR